LAADSQRGAFYLTDPRPEEVDVGDIAQALSRLCRYNGHLRPEYPLYSVAQHAFTVARWMAEDGHALYLVYAALHHDSAEAYYGDIITQVKYAVPALKPFMHAVNEAVNKENSRLL
jgi:5'-deoxynucleotidase YfbR-like HD superfamily hydrolase